MEGHWQVSDDRRRTTPASRRWPAGPKRGSAPGPDGVARSSVRRDAPPVPGRVGARRRRLLRGVGLGLVVCFVGGIAGIGYVTLKLRSIGRIAVPGIHPVGSGAPQTILLAGSDSRAGETAGQAQSFGSAAQVAGQRSDVIVLIHVNPATGKAAMLSIPRDMFVPIAGTSSSNRINVAFDTSPAQLVATIEQDFGIVINHYAQEDFSGLQGMTNAVGGVCMNFPYPVRDGSPTGTGNESGLNIPTAGRHNLNGAMALALVRSRYYQYFINGTWRAEGTGDIGRIQRQHSFMRALASKAIHASIGNPLTANAVLGKAVHDVKIDTSYTTLGLIRLGLHLRSLHPSGMPSFTLPSRAVNNYQSYGDVLMPNPAQDAAVIAAWEGYGASASPSPAATVAPSTITVRVLNGSGVTGQARTAADRLQSAGFSVAGYGTAAAPQHGGSVVAYGAGLKAAAQTVAAHLGGPITLRSDKQAGSMVIVTTGSAFTGVTGANTAVTSGLSSAAAAAAAAAADSTVPPWDPTPC
jgi:LCP family protein required for cell wall assembly